MQGRLWAISDIHVDFDVNAEFIEDIASSRQPSDGLIVAGDVSHDLNRLTAVLRSLKRSFGKVFFIPGNHDLWLRDKKDPSPDCLAKLNRILEICRELDVRFTPDVFESGDRACWIVPMFSWYRPDFSAELPGPPGPPGPIDPDAALADLPEGVCMDEHYCRWPERLADPGGFLLDLNESVLRIPEDGYPVISFSHFLPRPELLPAGRDLASRAFAKFAGDRRLDGQIKRLGSSLHIFGHSHESREEVWEGVKYLQNSLGYPRERGLRQPSLREIKLGDLRARPMSENQVLRNYPV